MCKHLPVFIIIQASRFSIEHRLTLPQNATNNSRKRTISHLTYQLAQTETKVTYSGFDTWIYELVPYFAYILTSDSNRIRADRTGCRFPSPLFGPTVQNRIFNEVPFNLDHVVVFMTSLSLRSFPG
ncbi:hypothetical protein TNIN_8121 [Trichonephila inaurata madagascariensis]|uniref:Uncharacterized protein n=1 Tax=Trichonephila inaurata madagascariensis TaxID=2747483 RepID=A0A8X7CDG6_9ARAC|nr:hypothetical protein TNIN_8121 [Trichonephila inaurata madagascariensis]